MLCIMQSPKRRCAANYVQVGPTSQYFDFWGKFPQVWSTLSSSVTSAPTQLRVGNHSGMCCKARWGILELVSSKRHQTLDATTVCLTISQYWDLQHTGIGPIPQYPLIQSSAARSWSRLLSHIGGATTRGVLAKRNATERCTRRRGKPLTMCARLQLTRRRAPPLSQC